MIKKDWGKDDEGANAARWVSESYFCYLIFLPKNPFQKCITKMSKFIFGRKKIPYKDFYQKKQVTNIFLIDISKVVFSIRKWERLAVLSWQCLSRHQRKYLAMVCLNTTKTQLIECHSMFLRSRSASLTMETSETRLYCSYVRSWQQRL